MSNTVSAVPAIAASGSLTVHLAWQQNGPSNWQVVYNRSGDGGQTWGSDQLIYSNGGPASSGESVDIATGSANQVYVVWTGNNVIREARSLNGGNTWLTVTQIITPASVLTGKPSLAIDVTGTLHLAWTESGSGWDICHARSSDGGTTWTNRTCNTVSSNQQNPDVAVDAVTGWIHTVWEEYRSGTAEIYYNTSSDGGVSWGAAKRISGSTGSPALEPAITVQDNGIVYAVWQDSRNGDDDVYYARSIDSGLTWNAAGRVNDDVTAQPQRHPAIASGNGLYAIWGDARSGDSDIFATALITNCPVSLIGVRLSGGTEITPSTAITFSATISPTNATVPIDYFWTPSPAFGQSTAQARYVWADPGHYTVTVSAANCGNNCTVSQPITVTCSQPVTGVNISGFTAITAGVPVTLNAIISPANARTPITYAWSPTPISGQGTAQVNYFWQDVGPHTITVTASNCSGGWGTFSDTHVITVSDSTLPAWSNFSPTGWITTSQTVNVMIHVQDSGSGLDISTAQYATSTNGSSFGGWLSAGISGADWMTTSQTVTANIAFGQDSGSGHLNQVKFRINDMAGNLSASSAYNVDIDTTAPSNPTSLSGDRNVNTWSINPTAVMTWSGATDASSGIQGYSYLWDQSAATIPDTTLDTSGSSASTTIPGDAKTWYFHVRTVDNVGHWASNAKSQGPYWLDTYPPLTPQIYSSDPITNVWTADNNIYVSFGGSSDASGSGFGGYSYLWDTSSTTTPDTITDTGNLSGPLASGTYWFHIRARDVAGNWTPVVHYGPFKIDTALPKRPIVVSSNPVTNVWMVDNTIAVTWTASSAPSGIVGYSYEWRQQPNITLDCVTETVKLTTTSSAFNVNIDGVWYFHIVARNGAGQCGAATHYGPFLLDTTPPSNPNYISSISHNTGEWSANPIIKVNWDGAADSPGSGVYGYSYAWGHSQTIPDTIVDTTNNNITSTLSDGAWIFYLRTQDVAGFWAGSTAQYGPFYIDTAPPTNPTACATTPPIGQWSRSVTATWSGAADLGSGVWGYSILWNTSPSTVPDASVDTFVTTTTKSDLTTSANWYLHIRTRDALLQWSPTAYHCGPIKIDATPPTSFASSPASVSSNSFTVSWSGLDLESGVASYDVQYRDVSLDGSWITWQLTTTLTSATFNAQSGHIYEFRSRARDNAGNVEDYPAGYDSRTEVATADLSVKNPGIEVNQSVQDLNNSVILIAKKRTFVRCYVDSAAGAFSNVLAELRVYRGATLMGTLAPSNAGGHITVKTNPSRAELDDSFYFDVTKDWLASGTVEFKCEVNPAPAGTTARRYVESNYGNNVRSVTVEFVRSPAMNLQIADVPYWYNGSVRHVRDVDRDLLAQWVRRAYPIHKLNVSWWELLPSYDALPDADTVNSDLLELKYLYVTDYAEDVYTRYYGMVAHVDGNTFMRGATPNPIPNLVSSGPAGDPSLFSKALPWDTDASYGDWYGGHELGHAYGLKHVACSGTEDEPDPYYPYPGGDISPTQDPTDPAAVYGFESRGPTIYGPDWKDVMTYCKKEWISPYTYIGIWLEMVWEKPGTAAKTQAMGGATGEHLAVFGKVVTPTDVITLNTFYRLPNAPDLPGRDISGTYSIRLFGAGDALLANYPFSPKFSEDVDSPVGSIAESVPWVTGTLKVAIWHNATALITRTVSANAPGVTLLYPNGGETLAGNSVTVTWSSSDADADKLTYRLDYSRDGGATWKALTVGITATQITLDLNNLPGTTQGKFRVWASDGVNTTLDASDGTFTVTSKLPRLISIDPISGTTYVLSQTVTFEASVFDLDDGFLPDANLNWSSSLMGPLGTGETLQTTELITGTHIVTLTATDSDGNSVTATTTVIVDTESPTILKVYLPLVLKNF
jgi:hypothetical protein